MDRRSPWLVWDKVEEDIPDGSYDFFLAVQKKKKKNLFYDISRIYSDCGNPL